MKKKQQLIANFIIPVLLFILFLGFFLSFLKTIPIRYNDEGAWIGRSYFFDLLIKRDFKNKLWHSYYSYDQPKLQEYVYGFWLYPKYLSAKKEETDLEYANFLIKSNFYEISGHSYKEYKNSLKNFISWDTSPPEISAEKLREKFGPGINPTLEIIFYARSLNAYLLATNLVVVYLLTLHLTSWPIALLNAIFYGQNNLLLRTGLISHSESLFLLLFNLGLLLLLKIFSQKKVNLITVVFFGFVSGLCTQTKLNGLMLLIFFNFLTFGFFLRDIRQKNLAQIKQRSVILIVTNLLVFFIFITLHPFFYANPSKNIAKIFQFRQETALNQAKKNKVELTGFGERIKTIYGNFFSKKQVAYYNGSPYIHLSSTALAFFLKLFFAVGLIYALKKAVQSRSSSNPVIIFILLFLLVQISLGLYLVINWDRYFVPLVIFFDYFQTLGLLRILDIFNTVRKLLSKFTRIR